MFLGGIIIFFWVVSINNRLGSLERSIKQTRLANQGGAMPQAKTPEPAKIFQNQPEAQFAPAAGKLTLEPAASHEENTASYLSKIGVVALLFGVAFFFKYAIDQGWISQWTRIIIGICVGGLFMILGQMWREKYPKYAPALSGGGSALVYFSFFAANQFYSLIPQTVALACMLFVSILTVYFAYKDKTQILAGLGICGSYLAPLLLHSNVDQHLGLFAYITLLNLAGLAVVFKGFWLELLYFSFFGTIVNYSVWAATYSDTSNTYASLVFLLLNFAFMILGAHIFFRKQSQNGATALSLPVHGFGFLSAAWGLFYAVAMYFLLGHNFRDILPWTGLLGGVISLIAYSIVDRLENKNVNLALSFVGLGLITLAIFWRDFGASTQIFLIASLGILSAIAGALLGRMELRFLAMAELVLAAILALALPYNKSAYVFLLNDKFGLMFFISAGFIFSGWLYQKLHLADAEKNADEVAKVIGAMLFWIAVSWEIIMKYSGIASQNSKNLLLSLWWIVFAVLLLIIGALPTNSIFRKLAIALFGASILKVFLYDVQALELGYRVVSFIVLGVILLGVSFVYQKNKDKITEFLKVNEKN